jgi:hypothetical protein
MWEFVVDKQVIATADVDHKSSLEQYYAIYPNGQIIWVDSTQPVVQGAQTL